MTIRKSIRWVIRHPRKALTKLFGGEVAQNPNHQIALEFERNIYVPSGRLKPGLNLIGYLCSEIGLGQAARNLAYAADNSRIPVSLRHLSTRGRENEIEFASKCTQIPDRQASLIVCGLPFIGELQDEFRPGRYNILYPYWELQNIPAAWLETAKRCDEIWAPSEFIASAIRQSSNRSVTLLRQPVRLPPAVPPPRLGRSTLKFFTFLDFDSYSARKNPQAAVLAFEAAFPQNIRDVELTVKTRGAGDDGMRKWLSRKVSSDARIKVVDTLLSRKSMDELIASTDVYISLHRSEGFGFGAAEALAAGKIVVATDYSGTMDFINSDTGYPVQYRLKPVQKGEYLAEAGQSWADADIDAAAQAFRGIYDQPDSAYERTRRGFSLLLLNHGVGAVGARMRQLLAERGLLQT